MWDRTDRLVGYVAFIYCIVACLLATLGCIIGKIMLIPLTLIYVACFVHSCKTVFKREYIDHEPPHTVDEAILTMLDL